MTRWRKVRAVAAFEFLCTVRSKGWLIATFGMPVFVLLYAGLVAIPTYLTAIAGDEVIAYGVVDEAGLLGPGDEVPVSAVEIPDEIRSALRAAGHEQILASRVTWTGRIAFRRFPTRDAAHAAMKDGQVRGYYRVPPDYLATGLVESYSSEVSALTGSESRRALDDMLARALLRGRVSDELAARIRKPIAETKAWIVTAAGELKPAGGVGRAVRLLVPLGFAVLLLISIMMSAGGLIQAMAIEKENKVVEVLLSSASAHEILMGKLLGLGATGLIQMTTWFGMVAAGGAAFAGTLAALGVDPPYAGMAAAVGFFPLAYLFFGSLMLGTGSLGSTQKEAQQWGMVWSLLAVVPVVFLSVLLHEPHGVVGRVLTWIPFASPITIVVRLTMDPDGIAWWEVAGPGALLAGCTWLAIRLGGSLFRVGILLTGARPTLGRILRQARMS